MFARSALVWCCTLACLHVGSAQSSDLVVYLNAGVNQSAAALPYLQKEAESLMRTAGYTIRWRDGHGRLGEDAANVVMIDLDGACTVPMTPIAGVAAPDDSQPRLASTAVDDGIVLPYSHVDCAALTRLLSGLFAREAPARRTFLYGRALGRLLAHEWYHVLAQTRDHAAAGIGKPCFTAADLVADRFEFESTTLAKLRSPAVEPAAGSAPDTTGR